MGYLNFMLDASRVQWPKCCSSRCALSFGDEAGGGKEGGLGFSLCSVLCVKMQKSFSSVLLLSQTCFSSKLTVF